MDESSEMIYGGRVIYKWKSSIWSSIRRWLAVTYCYAIEINYSNKPHHADTWDRDVAFYLRVLHVRV